MAAKTKASKQRPPIPDIPLAEWIASGIGLLLVGFTVGYLIYTALTQEDTPPDIQVELISVSPLRQGYLARFRATNHGNESANDIHIIGVHGTGAEAEESEATIDFLPGSSHKGGGLFFTREPSAASLSLRAAGYQEP